MEFFFIAAGKPASGEEPSSLKKVASKKSVLDWQLHSIKKIAFDKIHLLGGYQAEKIIKQYPLLLYSVIPEWEKNNILYTLLKAPFTTKSDTIITYSDTLFRPEIFEKLIAINSDVVLVYDSFWKDRYSGRSNKDIEISELINLENGKFACSNVSISGDFAEFTGLVKFGPKVTKYLINQCTVGNKINLIDLLDELASQNFKFECIDVKGDWAELNNPADLAHFILGTKAETLYRLKSLVTKSQIGKQVTFKYSDWKSDHDKFVKKIRNEFPKTKIIIRSTSNTEDRWNNSLAGHFDSHLGIDSNFDEDIIENVNSVFKSYDNSLKPNSRVLIQEVVTNILLSGVVFTCDLETGAFFYRLNYDDKSQSTETVTSGSGKDLRTVISQKYNMGNLKAIDKRLNTVLDAIREIEGILNFEKLDIEFALDKKNNVHIFQVRPITIDHSNFEVSIEDIIKHHSSAVEKFTQKQDEGSFVLGKKTFFSNMSDWNPAEIIGTKPKPLAFSLYSTLITNDIWAKQRSEFGYRDVRPVSLLQEFCGQPYVDIRSSINSFIPKSLADNTAELLINAYLDILKKTPSLHDKIEFEVVFTTWFPGFKEEAEKRFAPYSCSIDEIRELEKALKKITKKAFSRLDNDIRSVNLLESRRSYILNSNQSHLKIALDLLYDCKEFGTLAFAHAARAGFIAISLLKGLVSIKILSEEQKNTFLNSLDTITRKFESDRFSYFKGHISKTECIKRYGHLRPGTYDIEMEAYWESPEKYIFYKLNQKPEDIEERFPEEIYKNIQIILDEHNFGITSKKFLNYIKEAIRSREFVKYKFTKNLSLALDYIVKFGEESGLTRKDLSFLDINDFEKYHFGELTFKYLKTKISENKKKFKISQMVELPQIIFEKNDFYSFERHSSQPNFVTKKSINAQLVVWTGSEFGDLQNKIVLIEKADPGFDWLFGYDIAGLITKYGGANSHMTIRAAELGIPSAIGVGEKMFDSLCNNVHIYLDCRNLQIRTF